MQMKPITLYSSIGEEITEYENVSQAGESVHTHTMKQQLLNMSRKNLRIYLKVEEHVEEEPKGLVESRRQFDMLESLREDVKENNRLRKLVLSKRRRNARRESTLPSREIMFPS